MTFQSQTQKIIVKSSNEKEKVYFAIAGARLTSSEAKPTSPSSVCVGGANQPPIFTPWPRFSWSFSPASAASLNLQWFRQDYLFLSPIFIFCLFSILLGLFVYSF